METSNGLDNMIYRKIRTRKQLKLKMPALTHQRPEPLNDIPAVQTGKLNRDRHMVFRKHKTALQHEEKEMDI